MNKGKTMLQKIFVLLLTICLIGGLLPIINSQTVRAEGEDEENETADVYDAVMDMANNPPSDWNQKKDPYGYGEGNMFFLATQQELLLYRYDGHRNQTIKSYDTLKKKNKEYPLDGVKSSDSYEISKLYTLSHAQTIAFDPSGSGRKDHIAVIGVYADDYKNDDTKAHIYVYVMDKNGNVSPLLDLGKASWISDNHATGQELNNDYMWDFNAKNFMGITAGDYDGDGKDSLVVWACGGEPLLKQIDVDSNNGDIDLDLFGANGYQSVPDDDSWEDGDDADGLTHYLYYDTPDQIVENRLCVALGSGDFNGDGVDDLAVLSYVDRVTGTSPRNYQDRWGYYYIPMYSVSYGKKGDSSSICAGKDSVKNIAVEDTWSGNSHIAPMAAGLATGDIDGDGRDEVIISGIYHEVSGSYWTNSGERKEVADAYATVDKTKMVTAIYRGKSCLMFKKDMATNMWTRGNDGSTGGYFTGGGNATYADQAYQQMGVETVAINGKGSAELVFINGDLYTYGNGKLTCVFQPDYFQEVDGATNLKLNKETYMRSMAVGNFDGNEEGREQIAFVTAAALEAGADPFYVSYSLGMIGGIYEDEDGNPQPQAMSYYCTDQDVLEDVDHYYPDDNGGRCTIKDCLNFDLCAWDNDGDGLHVKYAGKEYIYTDPSVMAIVQAPPYFEEVKSAMTDMETSYSITTSYEYSSSHGNSTSFGVGADYEMEAEVVKLNVAAGYATDWSESFENSWTESDEYTLTAYGEDQVLIYRTPVTIYKYLVEVNNEWSEDNFIEVSFPGKSAIMPMSVKEYNEFALKYNEEAQRLAELTNAEAEETIIPEDRIPHLEPIVDQYLGHEGDPYGYMDSSPLHDVTILQETPLASGVGSSSLSYAWSLEHATGHEESNSHGFSFEFQLMFQWHATPHVGMALGGHVSLDYMRDYSTSTTEAKGTGASCTIGNLDPEALEELGLDTTSARQYGFNYQLVTWPSNIKLTDSIYDTSLASEYDSQFDYFDDENSLREPEYVPVYGYMLSGIRAATPPVTDLDSQFKLDENENMNILLTWSDPSDANRRVNAYVIYQIQKDGSYTRIDTVPGDTTEYLFSDIDGRNEYKFVVRTKSGVHELYEGVNSNVTYLYVEANALYAVELTSSDENSDTYTITHTDGTKTTITVRHGVGIADIKKVESSEDGIYDTYTIFFTDGTTVNFVVRNGTDGRDVELRTYQPEGSNKQIIQWRYVGEEEWHDLTEVSDAAFVQGRKVELRVYEGYIQWHYEGDEGWYDLITIDELKGEKGDQGLQGPQGKQVELRVNDEGMIQWHYEGEDEWYDLLASSDSKLIKGDPGREVELQVDKEAGEIQWRYADEDEWHKLIDLSELKGDAGTDGREVEFRFDEIGNQILWRYTGDEEWRELVVLKADFLKGDDGREIELFVNEDSKTIQWRYTGDSEWRDLIALSELEGKAARELELTYNAKKRAVMWRYAGDENWNELFIVPETSNGNDGRGIVSVDKTSSNGLIDTYTISYTDGTTSVFTVTNGSTTVKTEQSLSSVIKIPEKNSQETVDNKLDTVGIRNINVDTKGDLIITLTDGSTVISGNIYETEQSSKKIKGSGSVKTYFFDIPYNDFVSLEINGKTASDGLYTVRSLGDGVLLTIREDAVPASGELTVIGMSGSATAKLNNAQKSTSSLPWMNILLICWNTVLTAGMIILAGKFSQLKKMIK
ncbi:MAG: fibronectin type III domain-containing protein [Erysipelotrichaceae bacterium]|nr:fibronectin type III domain-containing protein [Erysipelotrichaceae bacterium]